MNIHEACESLTQILRKLDPNNSWFQGVNTKSIENRVPSTYWIVVKATKKPAREHLPASWFDIPSTWHGFPVKCE